MRRKKLRALPWVKIGLITLASLGALYLLTYRLAYLPGRHLSYAELKVMEQSSSWEAIISNPMFLPVKVLHHVIELGLGHNTNIASRLPSVILAYLTLVLFAYILYKWYGKRTAILGSIAFAVSAWFLHVGRSGSFDIAYLLAVPLLLTAYLILYNANNRSRAIWFWLVSIMLLLYSPGLVWLVAILVILQREELKQGWEELRFAGYRILLTLLGVVLALPLVYGFYMNLSNSYFLNWLGITTTVPSIFDPLISVGYSIISIFVKSPTNPAIWLGHLPILDVFMVVMFAMGAYFYSIHWRAGRSRMLLTFLIITIALIAAQGRVTRSLMVPILYLVAAGGMAFALHLWLRIFPRNPLARGFGIFLISLALALSCLYNLRLYFVAWPHNQATREVYSSAVSRDSN